MSLPGVKRKAAEMTGSFQEASEPEAVVVSELSKIPELSGNHLLLVTGQYSDMTILSCAYEFRVHKSIVCLKSEVIKKLIDGVIDPVTGIKINNDGSPDTGSVITLDEADPKSLECMLQFMYLGDYTAIPTRAITPPPSATASLTADAQISSLKQISDSKLTLLSHTRVHILAAKYEVTGLKELSSRKITKILTDHGDDGSFSAALELMFQEPAAVFLRRPSIIHASYNYKRLINQSAFRELCSKDGMIVTKLLMAISKLPYIIAKEPNVRSTNPAALAWHKRCETCKSDMSVRPNTKKEIQDGIERYYCEDCDELFN